VIAPMVRGKSNLLEARPRLLAACAPIAPASRSGLIRHVNAGRPDPGQLLADSMELELRRMGGRQGRAAMARPWSAHDLIGPLAGGGVDALGSGTWSEASRPLPAYADVGAAA